MDWVMMEKDMLGDESGGGNIHKDGDSENDEGGLLKDDQRNQSDHDGGNEVTDETGDVPGGPPDTLLQANHQISLLHIKEEIDSIPGPWFLAPLRVFGR